MAKITCSDCGISFYAIRNQTRCPKHQILWAYHRREIVKINHKKKWDEKRKKKQIDKEMKKYDQQLRADRLRVEMEFKDE